VVMQNVVQCLFSVFIIRWTSYLYIRVFVSSRVCGILVVEGPLLICMYCNVCVRRVDSFYCVYLLLLFTVQYSSVPAISR
jgi:hypothetical protein